MSKISNVLKNKNCFSRDGGRQEIAYIWILTARGVSKKMEFRRPTEQNCIEHLLLNLRPQALRATPVRAKVLRAVVLVRFYVLTRRQGPPHRVLYSYVADNSRQWCRVSVCLSVCGECGCADNMIKTRTRGHLHQPAHKPPCLALTDWLTDAKWIPQPQISFDMEWHT